MTVIKAQVNVTPPDRLGLREPRFYHRQHDHDIPTPENPKRLIDQCKRFALVAFPFIGLCRQFAKPLSLVSDGLRGLTSLSSISDAGSSRQKALAMVNTGVSAAALAGTLFANPLGQLITTGHDLALNSANLYHALNDQEYKKAAEVSAQMVVSSLYLCMFFSPALELWMLASSAQVLFGMYRSADDFQKGNYIEGTGHLLFAAIRTKQVNDQRGLLKNTIHLVNEKKPTLDEVLKKYANPPKGWPLVNHVVQNNDYLAAQVLLENGYEVNGRSPENWVHIGDSDIPTWISGGTPIEIAIELANLQMTKLLLHWGADPTLLGHGCYDRNRSIVIDVIDGYPFNVYGRGEFYRDVFYAFIDAGVDLKKPCIVHQGRYPQTPLDLINSWLKDLEKNVHFGPTLREMKKAILESRPKI